MALLILFLPPSAAAVMEPTIELDLVGTFLRTLYELSYSAAARVENLGHSTRLPPTFFRIRTDLKNSSCSLELDLIFVWM